MMKPKRLRPDNLSFSALKHAQAHGTVNINDLRIIAATFARPSSGSNLASTLRELRITGKLEVIDKVVPGPYLYVLTPLGNQYIYACEDLTHRAKTGPLKEKLDGKIASMERARERKEKGIKLEPRVPKVKAPRKTRISYADEPKQIIKPYSSDEQKPIAANSIFSLGAFL